MLKDLNYFLADEYVKYAKDGKLTVAMLQEKARYAKFLEEIENNCTELTPKIVKEIRKTVENTYNACYKGMAEAVKTSQNLNGLNVQPDVMKNSIDNPISGLTLPDVLEKNRKEIIYDIKQAINIALMNGDRYETTAKKLTEKLDFSYGKAMNIVRTETHRARESGFMDCAKDISKSLENSDLVYVAKWCTMKDERVRPQRRYRTKKGWVTKPGGKANHQKMEGVTIKVGDKFQLEPDVYAECPGQSGTARNDCRCRCYLEYDLIKKEEFRKKVDKSGESGIIKENSFNEIETETSKILKNRGIEYLPVEKHSEALSINEMINLVAGGDMTSGSCASVALAYVGQRQGWNVLDFRNGSSRDFFSSKMNKVKLFQDIGAESIVCDSAKSNLTNGKRILNQLEKDTEYYLSVGRHAAIVRNNDGTLQYLELQSSNPDENGWHNFGDVEKTLKWRFGCSESSRYYSDAYATDISQLSGDDFRTILGYINTDESSQNKGVRGNVK